MTTLLLEYRFTKSVPALRSLTQTLSRPLPKGTSEPTEKVHPFEFIDESLQLLAALHETQDELLRREFEQQREFITGKFEREQYENGRRDNVVEQRFQKIQKHLEDLKNEVKDFKDEVGHRFAEFEERFDEFEERFDRAETELKNFRQEVTQRSEMTEQRFDEMRAMMFNSLSYRAHHHIRPVPVFVGNRLQMPGKDYFPNQIGKFWRLHTCSKKKAYDRFRLLQFYSIEGYQRWNREDEFSIESNDESDTSAEPLTLENAARLYPSKCLEALAARLGLNYEKICAEMKRLQEYQQQTTAQKRSQDVSLDGEISKRAHISSAPSSTSELQQNQGTLQVPNSQGTTDLVCETDFLTDRQSQRSTEVQSLEGGTSFKEEKTTVPQ